MWFYWAGLQVRKLQKLIGFRELDPTVCNRLMMVCDSVRRVAPFMEEISYTGENAINTYGTYTIYTSKCAGHYPF